MKYLMTFEAFNSAPLSKGSQIEYEKEMQDWEDADNEAKLKKMEMEAEEEMEEENEKIPDKKIHI